MYLETIQAVPNFAWAESRDSARNSDTQDVLYVRKYSTQLTVHYKLDQARRRRMNSFYTCPVVSKLADYQGSGHQDVLSLSRTAFTLKRGCSTSFQNGVFRKAERGSTRTNYLVCQTNTSLDRYHRLGGSLLGDLARQLREVIG